MPNFPKKPPFRVYWCPNCEAWFQQVSNHLSCYALHSPGSCCHHHERKVEICAKGTNDTLLKMGAKLHALGTEVGLGWGENVVDGLCEHVRAMRTEKEGAEATVRMIIGELEKLNIGPEFICGEHVVDTVVGYVRHLRERSSKLNDAALRVVKAFNFPGLSSTTCVMMSDLPKAVAELQKALRREFGMPTFLERTHSDMQNYVRTLEDEVLRLRKGRVEAVLEAQDEVLETCARIAVRRSVMWTREDDRKSRKFREGVEKAASDIASALRGLKRRKKP